jgi:ATP-dependent DNA helicase PIF1
MQAKNDNWFVEYLLRIENGTEKTFSDNYVQLPDDIIVEWRQSSSKNANKISSKDNPIDNLIEQLKANCTSADYMRECAILSTTNEHIDATNAIMIKRFPGNEKVYYSFDSLDDDTRNNYPLDFLNSITPNGLPPHELKIKKDYPIILLRNLDPHNGLCNCTRLVIRGFQNNTIDAEIVNGDHARTRIFIPRILMSPSKDLTLPFKFK